MKNVCILYEQVQGGVLENEIAILRVTDLTLKTPHCVMRSVLHDEEVL
jgi:hypothetical protein